MNKKARLLANTHATTANSLWRDAWRRLSKHKLALGGMGLLVIIGSACLFAPLIAPYDPHQQNLKMGPSAPSATHWLGTDLLGRDLLSRILFGGRVSFAVGFIATAVSLTIGVTYGIISGYSGGTVDRVMMRIVEILYSLPFIVFVILLVTLFGRNLWLIFFAIGAVEWLTMARIVRGQVMHLKEQPFIASAKTLGQSDFNIMFRHLLPNLLGIIIVYTTLTIPSVMLLESFISFLGLGVQAPDTSWGDLIKMGAENMEEYSWLLLYPSIVFSLTLFSLNFLGDGLRDAFDPRTEKV